MGEFAVAVMSSNKIPDNKSFKEKGDSETGCHLTMYFAKKSFYIELPFINLTMFKVPQVSVIGLNGRLILGIVKEFIKCYVFLDALRCGANVLMPIFVTLIQSL